jgi:hypothetical protein
VPVLLPLLGQVVDGVEAHREVEVAVVGAAGEVGDLVIEHHAGDGRLADGEGEGFRAGQLVGRRHEGDPELARVRAVGGHRGAGPLEGAAQGAHRLGHLHRAADPRHQRGDGGVRGERDRAGHRLDEDEAQRVHVRPPVDRLALRLLRRGVAGRAQHGALRLGPSRLGQRPGQPEVGDAQPPVLPEEQVGRLHVPVDEAPAVRVVQGPGRLEADEERLAR